MAECLLTAWGTQGGESDAADARAMAGAIMVAEAMNELKLIRELLSKQPG